MNFRRYYVPNSIVFITQVVNQREPIFQNPKFVELLRAELCESKAYHPFSMVAYVFLPDHFHMMIHPTGASNFSKIMLSFKPNFTKKYKALLGIQGSMKFWQKRFRDHIIRDENDYEWHFHYIHYNPVKHGYVSRPEDWTESSFLEWKSRGMYADKWGWNLPDSLGSFDVDESDMV